METISFIREVITIITLMVGAYVAWQGLNTWKKQLKGTSEYDVARNTLRTIYKLRNSIEELRNPFMSAEEQGAAIIETGLEIDKINPIKGNEGTIAAFWVRWKKVYEVYQEFELMTIDSETLWGEKIKVQLHSIKKKVIYLNGSLGYYLDQMRHPSDLNNGDDIFDLRKIIYSRGDVDKDPFWKDLLTAINDVEKIVRPYLKS